MENLKDKLTNALGGIGTILFFVLRFVISILPLLMIDTPFIITFLILTVMQFFPPITIFIWIWGLVGAVQGPQDFWAILYYIVFAVVAIPLLIELIELIYLFFKKD